MKLYQKLEQQKSMPSEYKFAYSVLKRLAIIESCTAMNVAVSRKPNQAVQASCSSLHQSPAQTSLIIEIFADIANLATLIAKYCNLESGRLTAQEIKKQGSKSMQGILGRCKPYELEEKIDAYINKYSMNTLEHINNTQCLTQPEIIKEIILECYTRINEPELDLIITNMAGHLAALNAMTPAVTCDWVEVPSPTAANIGMFKPEIPELPAAAEARSICAIC
jgi:hypothetical protein